MEYEILNMESRIHRIECGLLSLESELPEVCNLDDQLFVFGLPSMESEVVSRLYLQQTFKVGLEKNWQ